MRAWVDLTIGAGKVGSTLTDFPVCVDLSSMPAPWWEQCATLGGDIRVKSAGVDLPIDLVVIDKFAKTGRLFFKAPTLTTGSQTYQVECGTGISAPAVTDPIGRNAVWSLYECVLSTWDTSLTDRTGNNGAATIAGGSFSGGNYTLAGSANTGAYIDTHAAPSNVWCFSAGADRADAGQRNVLDLSSSAGANRSILAFRGSVAYSLWDSTDDWMSSGINSANRVRLFGTRNGTTNRKIYTDGVVRNTDTTVAVRNEVRLYVGRRQDGDASATWNGDLYGPIYKRHTIPTDDWIAAEFAAWDSPTTFYSASTTTNLGSGAAHETDTAHGFTIPVDLGAAHETDTAHALVLFENMGIPHEIDTAYPLTLAVPPAWTATIIIGDHEWTIAAGECIADDVRVLDNLKIGWAVDEAAPWPAQPDPPEASVGLWTDDVANLADVGIGTTMSIVLVDADEAVFATFHGRVAQLGATPQKFGTDLFVRYAVQGVGYNVDLNELPIVIPADWPAESGDDRFDRIIAAILAAGGPSVEAPADVDTAAFEALTAGTTTAGALLAEHLEQVAIPGEFGPVRYYLVPVVDGPVRDHFECVLMERTVDAALLPGTFAVEDGLLVLVFPDLEADGMVDACNVEMGASWNRLKYRAVNHVVVSGETLTAEATRPGPDVRLTLDTTLTDLAAAGRMAEIYLPDLDESNGWVPDTLRLLAWRDMGAIVPAWFPDHREDPATSTVYTMPIVVDGIPDEINLPGTDVYAGQLVSAELEIADTKVTIDFALRRQLPVGIGDDAASWEWAQAEFPTVDWEDIDPGLSWYEARLGKAT